MNIKKFITRFIVTDLHLINSVGQVMKEMARPAPAPQMVCWVMDKGAPGSDLKRTSICPLAAKRMALVAATVARGAPMPLYRPRRPSAATSFLTAWIELEYLVVVDWPGDGIGRLWSWTLMVSNG